MCKVVNGAGSHEQQADMNARSRPPTYASAHYEKNRSLLSDKICKLMKESYIAKLQ